tara:strand:+ start:852 stop:1403 length:552 start_codon:yes stop_codon:yes gene_type:complete
MTSPTSNTASVPFALLMHDVYVSQDFDPYAEDDPEDEDYVDGSKDKSIHNMSEKELEDLLTKKTTELKVLETELAVSPVMQTMKEFATATPADKEAEMRAVLGKVRVVLKDEWFQHCSPAELRLISKLAEATARKKELPDEIARMSEEVSALKGKYAEVLAATRIEKLTKKATAKAVGKRARN